MIVERTSMPLPSAVNYHLSLVDFGLRRFSSCSGLIPRRDVGHSLRDHVRSDTLGLTETHSRRARIAIQFGKHFHSEIGAFLLEHSHRVDAKAGRAAR